MRFKLPIDLRNQSADDTFVRWVDQAFNLIQQIFNGRVGLTDNCATSLITVTIQQAHVSQTALHTLNKIPIGYLQAGSTVGGLVFNGVGTNSKQYLYVQATVAGTYTLLVF